MEVVYQLFDRFVRFGIVGAAATAIDFALTWFLKEKLRWHKYMSNAIGFIVSATANYWLNRVWTFRSEDPEVTVQYLTFILVASLGMVLNFALVYFFHNRRHMNFYVSKAFATAIVVAWNFAASYMIVFR